MNTLAAAIAAIILALTPTAPAGEPDSSSSDRHTTRAEQYAAAEQEIRRWIRETSFGSAQEHEHLTPQLEGAAAAIAACESGARQKDGTAEKGTHDWRAQNSRSTASGAYQFVDGTWAWVWEELLDTPAPTSKARYASPLQQTIAFHALWNEGHGARHWQESRSCWQNML